LPRRHRALVSHRDVPGDHGRGGAGVLRSVMAQSAVAEAARRALRTVGPRFPGLTASSAAGEGGGGGGAPVLLASVVPAAAHASVRRERALARAGDALLLAGDGAGEERLGDL